MQLRQVKFTSPRKIATYVIIYGLFALALMSIFYRLLVAYNEWSTNYRWFLQAPVRIVFQRVWNVEKRQPLVTIQPWVEEDTDYDHLNDTEKKICDKWGMYECKTAIAVAKAESGLKPEAIHYNSNDTFDAGIFQINSIHWEKCGGLKALLDEDTNIECAYQMWTEQGWTPWAVFNNNRFKENL